MAHFISFVTAAPLAPVAVREFGTVFIREMRTIPLLFEQVAVEKVLSWQLLTSSRAAKINPIAPYASQSCRRDPDSPSVFLVNVCDL